MCVRTARQPGQMEEETCAVRNQVWTGKAVTYRDPDVIPGGSIATGCEGCSRPACLFTLEVKKTKMLAKSRATSLLLPLAALAALPVLRSTPAVYGSAVPQRGGALRRHGRISLHASEESCADDF